MGPGESAIPVACASLPLFKDPEASITSLPVQMNFHAITLDLDRKEDLTEYERIMTYLASGYGMKLVNIERILINKKVRITDESGVVKIKVKRKVRRVYLEYYAPYRIIPTDFEKS